MSDNFEAFVNGFPSKLARGNTEHPWLETLSLLFYRNESNTDEVTTRIDLIADFTEHTIDSITYKPASIVFKHAPIEVVNFVTFTATIHRFDPQEQPRILDVISRVTEDVRPADGIYRIYEYNQAMSNYTLYQSMEASIMEKMKLTVTDNQTNVSLVFGEPDLATANVPNTYFNTAEYPGIETTLGDAGTIRVRKSATRK